MPPETAERAPNHIAKAMQSFAQNARNPGDLLRILGHGCHLLPMSIVCQKWFQQTDTPCVIVDDGEGTWVSVPTTSNPAGVYTTLQNDLAITTGAEVYLAYLQHQGFSDNETSLAGALDALRETATGARMLHATEPVACDQALRRSALNTFRNALTEGNLTFLAQPIASTESLAVHGQELLARLRPPRAAGGRGQHQAIPPKDWIPYVINSHDSIRLARFVTKAAEDRLKAAPCSLEYISINLTALNFLDDGLQEQLLSMPAHHRHRLVLELTEWKNPKSHKELPAIIDRLRSAGIQIAIDDFGSGYSSTDILREIVFDIVKIDMHLVKSTSRTDQQLIDWILKCAANMKAKVVAEGIENEALLNHARVMGVPYGQGWHIDAIVQRNNEARADAPHSDQATTATTQYPA